MAVIKDSWYRKMHKHLLVVYTNTTVEHKLNVSLVLRAIMDLIQNGKSYTANK